MSRWTEMQKKPRIEFGKVIFCAIALFLPLAYLFFDLFVLVTGELFTSPDGNIPLHELMARLGSPAYATNTVGEIAEAFFGSPTAVLEFVTPMTFLMDLFHKTATVTALSLPVFILFAFLAGCVTAGVFLIITGGRILRVRWFTDLTVFCGTGAVFAPVIGNLVLRAYYLFGDGFDGADAAMQEIMPSVESLCIMGILAFTLLPALVTLKGITAKQKNDFGFVGFPFRPMARLPVSITRIVTLALYGLAVLLMALFFTFPISTTGETLRISELYTNFSTYLEATNSAFRALLTASGDSEGYATVAQSLMGIAGLIWIAALAVALIDITVGILKTFFATETRLREKKSARAALRKASSRVRFGIISPAVCFLFFQAILVLTTLFASPVGAHLDFSNVDETISLLYLVYAYARSLGNVTTQYLLVASLGGLVWYSVGQTSRVMILRSNRRPDEEKSASSD